MSTIIGDICPRESFVGVRVKRMARYSPGKVRPIIASFQTTSEVLQILKSKNKLRGRNIYIKSDQTTYQRQYLKDLIKTMEERKKKGEVDLKIGYYNGMPKIMKSLVPKNQ